MNANRDMSVGEAMPSRDFTITRDDLEAYADASGDQNPIHQDEAFALSVGLPGVIAHGMFTMGLLARAVQDWAGPGSILEIGVRFTRPVVVGPDGAVVTIAGTVSAVDDTTATLDLSATAAGQTVVSRARATVRRA
jgi:acyl dehydratase